MQDSLENRPERERFNALIEDFKKRFEQAISKGLPEFIKLLIERYSPETFKDLISDLNSSENKAGSNQFLFAIRFEIRRFYMLYVQEFSSQLNSSWVGEKEKYYLMSKLEQALVDVLNFSIEQSIKDNIAKHKHNQNNTLTSQQNLWADAKFAPQETRWRNEINDHVSRTNMKAANDFWRKRLERLKRGDQPIINAEAHNRQLEALSSQGLNEEINKIQKELGIEMPKDE